MYHIHILINAHTHTPIHVPARQSRERRMQSCPDQRCSVPWQASCCCLSVCIYTYVCIYIYIFTRIHTYIHTYIYIYIHMYTYTYKYTYIVLRCVCTHTHIYTYVCMYTCTCQAESQACMCHIYVYIYVYICVWICICIWIRHGSRYFGWRCAHMLKHTRILHKCYACIYMKNHHVRARPHAHRVHRKTEIHAEGIQRQRSCTVCIYACLCVCVCVCARACMCMIAWYGIPEWTLLQSLHSDLLHLRCQTCQNVKALLRLPMHPKYHHLHASQAFRRI